MTLTAAHRWSDTWRSLWLSLRVPTLCNLIDRPMLATVIEMLIGIGGTVIYLLFWNQALRRLTIEDIEPTDPQYRVVKRRRRISQIIFFLGLTPYVLVLFAAIERLKVALQ